MMTYQEEFIPRFEGRQVRFLYWPVQINEILKAEPVWHVVQTGDAASSSSLPQVQASDERSEKVRDPLYGRDVACFIFL